MTNETFIIVGLLALLAYCVVRLRANARRIACLEAEFRLDSIGCATVMEGLRQARAELAYVEAKNVELRRMLHPARPPRTAEQIEADIAECIELRSAIGLTTTRRQAEKFVAANHARSAACLESLGLY